jgi:anti-sigma factor ChrR (cupin superfamily)
MKREQLLPTELVWQDDGHVADVALAAIADGELEIVPDQAAAHVVACDDCSERLGEQALLSTATHEALHALDAAAVRRPLPLPAIVLALALAALGAAPAVRA